MWYTNLNVVPLLVALGRQSAVYAGKQIDMLGSAISLPGPAVRWAAKIESSRVDMHVDGELHVAWYGLPVNGVRFKARTAYQFHSCYWHARTGWKVWHSSRKYLTVSETCRQ